MRNLIDKLYEKKILKREELINIIDNVSDLDLEYLFTKAEARKKEKYGNDVYIRGLIEISNYCKNNCLYCGIRCGNNSVNRYRLTKEEILSCCNEGYALGFRTFVLQGGEDPYYTDDVVCDVVSSTKKRHPDCAVTLSIGEKSRESYERYFEAGVDRYLLRHETINKEHYEKLHPCEMSYENRLRCLRDLKDIGYQVGCGFMVGSPYQKTEYLADDLLFIKEFEPDMVGIGPFITHKDTPFKDMENGSIRTTLIMLSLLRLMKPNLLLPATTALGTLDKKGREKGIHAGANVLMPNLSPTKNREDYSLYDNKLHTGAESAQSLEKLKKLIKSTGNEIVISRGDVIK